MFIAVIIVKVSLFKMAYNVLRICEVRMSHTLKLNTNLNCVFHIYAVSNSYFYGY
jgi:hypothetical protein